jgi:hypothetical protein
VVIVEGGNGMRKGYGVVVILALFTVLVTPLVASACGGGEGSFPPPQTRLVVGMQARVSYTASGIPLRVREEPGLSGKYITRLPNGTQFTVIGGSEEIDNFIWWKITTADGTITGWLAEGEWGEYYVEPISKK